MPASPFEEVEATAVQQLGRPLSELFQSVEREALASASVAQVHRCKLKDGREAVIKVREGAGAGPDCQTPNGLIVNTQRVMGSRVYSVAERSMISGEGRGEEEEEGGGGNVFAASVNGTVLELGRSAAHFFFFLHHKLTVIGFPRA